MVGLKGVEVEGFNIHCLFSHSKCKIRQRKQSSIFRRSKTRDRSILH